MTVFHHLTHAEGEHLSGPPLHGEFQISGDEPLIAVYLPQGIRDHDRRVSPAHGAAQRLSILKAVGTGGHIRHPAVFSLAVPDIPKPLAEKRRGFSHEAGGRRKYLRVPVPAALFPLGAVGGDIYEA